MKITCSKRDDILKRKEAYEKDYNERKARHDEQYNSYKRAVQNVFSGVERAVTEAIGESTEDIEVYVSHHGLNEISCNIKGNNRDIFNKGKALSWTYTARISEAGEVTKETSSWSGLQATTPEQLDSLRETLRILEIINSLDWATILSVEMPDWKAMVTESDPNYDRDKPDFDRELMEADIEEAIGANKLIKCVGGSKNYRGEIYAGIVSETPSMYTIFDFPVRYAQPNSDGTYGWKNHATLRDLVAEQQGYAYRVKKDNFINNMVERPLEIIEY